MATVTEEQDREEKLRLAIERIIPHCTEDAEHKVFREMAVALKDNDKLVGEVLEGATNYSYKVFPEKKPSAAVFVKVNFTYALWNPDRTAFYDLERAKTEFLMMKKMKALLGDAAPVATPYLLIDITPEIRMIVAEWAKAHEPYAAQFNRGKVDRRILGKVAEFVATINLQDMGDPSFNEGIKNPMRALYPIAKGAFGQIIGVGGEPDHFVAYAKEMGQVRFNSVVDAMGAAYEKCEMLLHGDSHVLNILVEPETEEGNFGETGDFIMCDWEMVHHGVRGRDPGTFNALPINSACFLAAQGLNKRALEMIDIMAEFWDEYAKHMVEKGGKDDEYMRDLYRSSVGWCGVYVFIANFLLKLQWNFMPFDKISQEAGAKTMASIALIGLKLMEWSFLVVDPELTIPQMREWFASVVSEQIELLHEICQES